MGGLPALWSIEAGRWRGGGQMTTTSISAIPQVAVTITEGETIWTLTIPKCPYCNGRHNHGGGPVSGRPVLGFRVSHCLTGRGRQYELTCAPLAGGDPADCDTKQGGNSHVT